MPTSDQTIRERLRTAFQRTRKALAQRPYLGQGTAVTRVRVEEAFTCRIEDGRWQLTADLGEKAGGSGEGPDPGVFGRSALASCLAVGYVMWAAHHDVPIESLEVEVQADYDARGEYGVGDTPPEYSAIRYVVRVASPAPEPDILKVLDAAESHSPYLAIFRDPQRLDRAIEYSSSSTAF